MRRLRRTKALRDLVRETELSPRHLVQPLFVVAGEGVREPVESMPGIERFSISELVAEASELQAVGIEARDPVRDPGRRRTSRGPPPTTTRAWSSSRFARSRRRIPS